MLLEVDLAQCRHSPSVLSNKPAIRSPKAPTILRDQSRDPVDQAEYVWIIVSKRPFWIAVFKRAALAEKVNPEFPESGMPFVQLFLILGRLSIPDPATTHPI